MAEDKNKINSKDVEELRRLIRLLQKEISEVDLKKLIESGSGAKTLLESLRKEAKELEDSINDAAAGFKKIVQEIKNSNEGVNLTNKAFKGLSSIAEKVKLHQEGIAKLSSDEIKKLQTQAVQEKSRLSDANKLLATKSSKIQEQLNSIDKEINELAKRDKLSDKEYNRLGDLLSRQEKLNKHIQENGRIAEQNNRVINDQDAAYNAIIKKLELINKQTDDENKKLAGTKGLIAGINKIPFLGGMVDTNKMLSAATSKIAEGGTGTQALGSAFKNLGGQVKSGLLNPVTVVVFLVEQLVAALKLSDTAAGDLAKSFDVSYQGALNMRRELSGIANASMDAAVTTKGLQESMVAIGQTLGVNAQLNEKDLVTFTKLREQAGFTNEELVAMQRTTLATGGSLEDNTKSFMGTVAKMNAQNKLAINAKQLLKEVANVSDAIKLSVGGTAAKLAEAAFKAKQFGITLEQADKISESLLDFENSINNEISAELITGKDLNFEKARLLALNGDIAGASAEILKQVGGTAEFSKMNRIQQEAIAKAAGMTRDELAKSLVEREAAAKLGAAEGQSAQDRYNELVKTHGVARANEMLGNESLQRQFQQQSAQERFTQAVEKLKDVFVSIAEPILQMVEPLTHLITAVLPIANIVLMPFIKGVQVIADTINYVVGSVKSLFGLLTGSNEKLTVMQGIVGAIASIWLAYQGYVIASNVYMGISAALSERKLLAEQGSKVAMIAQRAAAGVMVGIQTALAVISGTKAIAEVTAAEAMSLGIATIAIIGGLAMVIGAMTSSKSKIKDGIVDPKRGPVLSGGFGTVQMDPKDKAMYGADGKIKVGTNLMGPPPVITAPPSPAITAVAATTAAATNTKQDNKEVINALKEIKNEQTKANSKPTIISNSMNGTQFGTAVATSTYKTQ
jgi:hypothetical protein